MARFLNNHSMRPWGLALLLCATFLCGADAYDINYLETCVYNVTDIYTSAVASSVCIKTKRNGLTNCTGYGIPLPSKLTGLANVQQIVFNAASACILRTDQTVSCVGDNFNGELGLDITKDTVSYYFNKDLQFPTGQVVAQLSANRGSYCALFVSGRATCWGSAGPLGNGRDDYYPGYYANSMGNSLKFVDVGTGRTIRQLVAASETNCALLDDGTVKCWGDCTKGLCDGTKTKGYSSEYYYCTQPRRAYLTRHRDAPKKKKTWALTLATWATSCRLLTLAPGCKSSSLLLARRMLVRC